MSAAPPATATDPTPSTDDAPARRPRRRLVLLVLAGVVAIVLGGGAAYALTMGGDDAPAADEPTPVEEGEILEIGTLTTNLAGPTPQYARVGVALVLAAGVDAPAVEADLALVKDAIISEVSRHAAADLRGHEGVQALRSGLSTAVADLFEDGTVVRVALTELLVQ